MKPELSKGTLPQALFDYPIIEQKALAQHLLPTQKIQPETVELEGSCNHLYFWLKHYEDIKKQIKLAYGSGLNCCQIRTALTEYYQVIDTNIYHELIAIQKAIDKLQLSAYFPEDIAEEQATQAQRTSFTIFALSLGFFEMMAGVAGMYEIIVYVCSILNVTLIVPIAIAVSLLFGLVSASVAAVFDIYAVAQAMEVPYLTACQELKTLIQQSQKLIETNRQMKKSLNAVTQQILESKDLKTIDSAFQQISQRLDQVSQIQAHVANRIAQYQQKIEQTQTKRKAYQMIWVLFASPIYAGTVVISANAVIALLPTFGFPPVGLAFAATFALLWVAVELYRFWSFERRHMILGLDSLIFGAPENKFTAMIDNSEVMQKKLNRNNELTQQIQTYIKNKKVEQEETTKLKQENKQLKADNDLLKTKSEEIIISVPKDYRLFQAKQNQLSANNGPTFIFVANK